MLLEMVRNDDAAGLKKVAGISKASAATLIDYLAASGEPEGLLGLEHGELLRDLPSIRYRKDDGKYYELAELSVGRSVQRC